MASLFVDTPAQCMPWTPDREPRPEHQPEVVGAVVIRACQADRPPVNLDNQLITSPTGIVMTMGQRTAMTERVFEQSQALESVDTTE